MQTEAEVRDLAWVGDAVLGLYAREYILTHPLPGQFSRHELYEQMTSNQFLSGLGEPTRMEAQIGQVYRAEGLQAAFAHIEQQILPLFQKQVQKGMRANRGKK
ncbi:MAG: hypothetical protein E1N59_2564 [Puniceicoccaceae bacterium 5H]|nr:MAG: hypothetical protein E1N59_2564 [Puniceicoccaceae bacterium 5H]